MLKMDVKRQPVNSSVSHWWPSTHVRYSLTYLLAGCRVWSRTTSGVTQCCWKKRAPSASNSRKRFYLSSFSVFNALGQKTINEQHIHRLDYRLPCVADVATPWTRRFQQTCTCVL